MGCIKCEEPCSSQIDKLRKEIKDHLRMSCVAPWTKLSTGCYLFHEEPMSQPNAQKFCKSVLSRLVEVNSQEENEAIKAEIIKRGFRSRKVEFWMGITDRLSEGNWTLESTGESLCFSDWKNGEPNDQGGEDCAHWTSSLEMKWHDFNCDFGSLFGYTYNALCEI